MGPTLVHGSGHRKGHPKLSRAGFLARARNKLAWARNKLVHVRTKLAWVGPQVIQPGI